MENISALKEAFFNRRPAHWNDFPDIELYKDQVLGYLSRQHALSPQDQLTGAMINNYIKSGLLPRAKGKKYNREHLAYLTAIYTLKQVLSVGDVAALLRSQPNMAAVESFYEKYWEELDQALKQTGETIEDKWTKEETALAALRLAILSYAQKLACEKLLGMLEQK